MNRAQLIDKLGIKEHQLKWIRRSYKVKDADSVAAVVYLKRAGLKPREIRSTLNQKDNALSK